MDTKKFELSDDGELSCEELDAVSGGFPCLPATVGGTQEGLSAAAKAILFVFH
jgi:hypothetical protein